jgi:hypothetical protein
MSTYTQFCYIMCSFFSPNTYTTVFMETYLFNLIVIWYCRFLNHLKVLIMDTSTRDVWRFWILCSVYWITDVCQQNCMKIHLHPRILLYVCTLLSLMNIRRTNSFICVMWTTFVVHLRKHKILPVGCLGFKSCSEGIHTNPCSQVCHWLCVIITVPQFQDFD